jgi:glycosyltransferase involved in cell wall biosynthesis
LELDLLTSDNLAKYLRYCRMYGVRSATRLAFRRLQKPRGAPPIEVTPLATTSSPQPALPPSPLHKRVSVIVPTKNAGPEIRLLVRKLRGQEGMPEPEIILVDSGSTDATLEIARRESVQTIQLAPEQFTHAFARNAGANRATGEYLLFMVQDALPLTTHWLWELVTALETNSLAAVSCAEYPRADSDLFYQFLIHDQYEAPGLNQDRIMAWDESCSSYLGLRANAQLSGITVLLRRDVFELYRYRTDYAEDLDLGIRLIRDGHKLGFLYNTRVLHSHNRPAYYFLKRGYVDVRYLADIFPNFLYPEIENRDRLCADIHQLYDRIAKIAHTKLGFLQPTVSLVESLHVLIPDIEGNRSEGTAVRDPQLSKFVENLYRMLACTSLASGIGHSMLLPHVSSHIEKLEKWLRGIYYNIDEILSQEILGQEVVSAIEKIFALHSGNHLAYLYLTERRLGAVDAPLARIDKTLMSGV